MTHNQTICPVTKSAVDTNLAVDAGLTGEYQGKVFYFCCPSCQNKFEGNPEKYLADLPQVETSSGGCKNSCC